MNLIKSNITIVVLVIILAISYTFIFNDSPIIKNNKVYTNKIDINNIITSLVKDNKFNKAYDALERYSKNHDGNDFNYLHVLIQKKEKRYVKHLFNRNSLLSAYQNMKILKGNRALENAYAENSGKVLEDSKRISLDLLNYYGVKNRTAYRIFAMYINGIFGEEQSLNKYVSVNNNGVNVINDELQKDDDNCIIDKYGMNCVASINDNYKPFMLRDELTKNGDLTHFLFKTNSRYNDFQFSFDKKTLNWKNPDKDDLTTSNRILINDIKSIELKRNTKFINLFSLEDGEIWYLVINSDQNKKIYLDYYRNLKRTSESEILPFVSSLVFILNNYKSTSLEPISFKLSDKVTNILQNKDYWAKISATYGDPFISTLETVDTLSDIAFLASTGGAAAAGGIAVKKLASKAAIKAISKKIIGKVKTSIITSSFKLKDIFKNIKEMKSSNIDKMISLFKRNNVIKTTKTITSGVKGNWNKNLNGNLLKNTTYIVKNITKIKYKTDKLGRVIKVKGKLALKKVDRLLSQQTAAGKINGIKDGMSGDDGAHLIASIFGGAGEQINYLAMNAKLNRGAWKKMENIWATALKEGKKVNVDISPIYKGMSKRPIKFQVTYNINGKKFFKAFKNTKE